MDYVQPSILSFTEQDPAVRIERCIRIAYKSEDKIGPGSADRIINFCTSKKHFSVLTHANAYIRTQDHTIATFIQMRNPKYLSFEQREDGYYVFGNMRAWYETIYNPYGKFREGFEYDINNRLYNAWVWLENMFNETWPVLFKCKFCLKTPGVEETPFDDIGINHNWYSFIVTTDIGVGKEWLRHTTLPPTQESTRYVNYSKKELQFCLPYPFGWTPKDSIENWVISTCSNWSDLAEDPSEKGDRYRILIDSNGILTLPGQVELVRLAKIQTTWEIQMETASEAYNRMLDYNAAPQEARTVLPHSTATTFVVSGDREAWDHFIILRDADDANPQIRILAENIRDFFKRYDANKTTDLLLGMEPLNSEHVWLQS